MYKTASYSQKIWYSCRQRLTRTLVSLSTFWHNPADNEIENWSQHLLGFLTIHDRTLPFRRIGIIFASTSSWTTVTGPLARLPRTMAASIFVSTGNSSFSMKLKSLKCKVHQIQVKIYHEMLLQKIQLMK